MWLLTETFTMPCKVRKEAGVQSYALNMILTIINDNLVIEPVTMHHHAGEGRGQALPVSLYNRNLAAGFSRVFDVLNLVPCPMFFRSAQEKHV